MTSIHCLSTSNQIDDIDCEDQQTLTNLTNDSKTLLDCASTFKTRFFANTTPEMSCFEGDQRFGLLSPFQIKVKGQKSINSNPLCFGMQDITEEATQNFQSADNKSTEEDKTSEEGNDSDKEEELLEDDDFPAPRQKSNTFTGGYISTHVPCELKKSRFGQPLNLSLKTAFTSEDSDLIDNEVESEKEIPLIKKESSTLNSLNIQSDFAKKRQAFFKTFKPESLRLITAPKDDEPQQNRPILKKENFDEKFEIHEKLGEGCHSVVRRCVKKDDHDLQNYAVKVISYKDPEYLFEILQEERVLSLLNHKNIIKHDSFFLEKEKKKAYIVSEYAHGKTLGQFIQNKRTFQMREVRSIAKQSLKALAHMHSKGIIHRDLSYNNIIYDPQSDLIKIIDFTVSKIVTIQKLLTNTGTLNFKAPEMLSGFFYSHSIDVFSLGVNLFALIFGFLPFQDDSDKTVINNIINKDPLEFYKNSNDFDPLLFNFLEGLLEKDPIKRMTALQALKHPWINKKITCDDLKVKQTRNKFSKIGISASTVAEFDDTDNDQDTFTSLNQFMVKTLVDIHDD